MKQTLRRPVLDVSDAPEEPLERLLWLSGVAEKVKSELDQQWRQAYFQARLEQRLDAALDLNLHPEAKVLAWTRAENETRGRAVRWGDGW